MIKGRLIMIQLLATMLGLLLLAYLAVPPGWGPHWLTSLIPRRRPPVRFVDLIEAGEPAPDPLHQAVREAMTTPGLTHDDHLWLRAMSVDGDPEQLPALAPIRTAPRRPPRWPAPVSDPGRPGNSERGVYGAYQYESPVHTPHPCEPERGRAWSPLPHRFNRYRKIDARTRPEPDDQTLTPGATIHPNDQTL